MKRTPYLLLALFLPLSTFAQEYEEIGKRGAEKPAPAASEEKAECNYIFDRYPETTFPENAHAIASLSYTGDSIAIEDGSSWKVSAYDRYKAKYWLTSDPLMITQNSHWFSNYTYRIINMKTKASVEANLVRGPLKNGPYTRYIYDLNKVEGTVKLTDKTNWEVSSLDRSLFSEWAIDDTIIIGMNSSWDFGCTGLLINVTMNNSVRAKQY